MFMRSAQANKGFIRAAFAESSAPLQNPGCGWYHIYSFAAQPPETPRPLEEETYLAAGEGERLALVRIDIGAFRDAEISKEALDRVEAILELFRSRKMQIILRFAYDTQGKGAEKEPGALALIKRHMEQLGAVARANAAGILALQGLFVGNWGEMHGSRFLTGRFMAELANTLYKATQGSCYLAVRRPAQWRALISGGGVLPGLAEKLALFNDGMFGSATDLGTYGTSREEAGETGPWSRAEELAWQSQRLGAVPNGGEALLGEQPAGFAQAAAEMAQMHVTYLNSAYQPEQLSLWKGETVTQPGCWSGCSGYDYIGRHLGYRFFVSGAGLLKGEQMQVWVKNCGFAGLCVDADCFLMVEEESGALHRVRLDQNPQDWKSGEETVLTVPLPEQAKGKRCRLFLRLEQKADGEPIRFANQGAEEAVFLGALSPTGRAAGRRAGREQR